MDELLKDPRFTLGVVTLLVSLLVWISRSYINRLELLEREAVRKEDLKELRDVLKAEHQENGVKLDGIEAAVTSTHRRIDDLYRDLMKARSKP